MKIYLVIEVLEDECGNYPSIKTSFLEKELADLFIKENVKHGYIEEVDLSMEFKNEETVDKVMDFYNSIICK